MYQVPYIYILISSFSFHLPRVYLLCPSPLMVSVPHFSLEPKGSIYSTQPVRISIYWREIILDSHIKMKPMFDIGSIWTRSLAKFLQVSYHHLIMMIVILNINNQSYLRVMLILCVCVKEREREREEERETFSHV